MRNIIQYNTVIYTRPPFSDLPGVKAFLALGKYFSVGLTPTDRTGTIRWPIANKLLTPIPEIRPMKKTYAELCDERGYELMQRAEKLDSDIYVLWSGGIDSTLVLVSLIKNATPAQRKRIVVLMSEESISEYPRFYEEYVHGKLRTESSNIFPYVLGTPSIITNGEQNDQLFGFDSVGRMMVQFGDDIIHKPYDRAIMAKYFGNTNPDTKVNDRFLDLFEKAMKKSPIPIKTHFDYLWWINFSQKWQNTFLRTLTCTAARNIKNVTPDYIRVRYDSFYGTDEFQLWSIHNHDKKIKKEWRSYKWPSKDAIYDFTKDADYRDNKIKRGSLHNVIMQQTSFNFIDEDFRFFTDLDPKEVFDYSNDFV